MHVSSINLLDQKYNRINKNNKIKDTQPIPQNNNLNFQGLTKILKFKTFIDGQKDIKEILNLHEGKSRIVGSLPKFIINKLPKENRKEAIMDFYTTFDKITEELRNFDETKATTIAEITNRRYDSTAKLYRDLLLKYNIVDKWTNTDIQYLGKGGKGAGYKLIGLYHTNMPTIKKEIERRKVQKQKIQEIRQTITDKRQEIIQTKDSKQKELLLNDIQKLKLEIKELKNFKDENNKKNVKNAHLTDIYDDEFVIKVFHLIEGANWHNFKSHGCYAELNSAQYWMNTVGADTQRGKFFWGSMKSGYMINKYVDDDVALPKRKIEPYLYGLKCTDEDFKKKHNVCKGYSFDWGGVRVVNRFKNGDRIARSVDGKIRDTEAKFRSGLWNKLFYDNKVSNVESKNAGLALSIKHLDNKTKYIDKCINLRQTKVNQALAYVLKYLPYDDALKYFKKLVKTKDTITQVILFNEIPLLAMKHRDGNIKDELGAMRSEILVDRVDAYYKLAEKYALPGSIEHLASFVHLLPKNKIMTNYKRLAQKDNYALHERLLYKLPNLTNEFEFSALAQLAKNVKDEGLREEIKNTGNTIDDVQKIIIRRILENPELLDKYRLY